MNVPFWAEQFFSKFEFRVSPEIEVASHESFLIEYLRNSSFTQFQNRIHMVVGYFQNILSSFFADTIRIFRLGHIKIGLSQKEVNFSSDLPIVFGIKFCF